jgi:enoyl-CoA hydratase
MATEKLFEVIQSDSILVLTLNRPKALNALNKQLIGELHHFFVKELKTYSCKGVILTGSGDRAFAAGADIKEFRTMDAREMEALSALGHELMFAIENSPIPVIAAIEGYALGGGFEIALACHMRIGSEKTRLGNPEVNLGIIPGYGATQRLPQLVGKGRSLEIMLTARMINASEALDWGLLNKVVAPGKTVSESKEILQLIGSKGTTAVTKVIDVVAAHYNKNCNGFQEEIKAFGKLSATDEFKEGTQAFIENREAKFKN